MMLLTTLGLAGSVLLTACKDKAAEPIATAPVAVAPAEGSPAGAVAAVAPTAKPFLWRIEGQKPSWLYGTIHLPDDRILALPAAVTQAVDGCDRFYAEIPLDPATQVQMTPLLMLPEGQGLSSLLPAELYQRLDKIFAAKGLPLSALGKLKIWAITTQVVLIDHILDFATKQPLDMALYSRAEQAGKQVGGLETVAEQMAVFDGLTQDEQIRMLAQTLDQIDEFKAKGQDPIAGMLEAYLAGDEAKMLATMLETYDPENELDRKVMKRLFFDRNQTMGGRIAEILAAKPGQSHFFAVGAGHLLGDDGMVALLRAKGFKLERIAPAK
jgi:uncharacterized protein YbaP (TraB family)